MNAATRNPDFLATLARSGLGVPVRRSLRTLQINVGKLCNQACHHCHVEAGPKRTEIMSASTARRTAELAAACTSLETIDLTGGAPELNPSFRYLVENARASGLNVIVRCNLTVIFEPGMGWLPEFYRDNSVELVCSLPCYTAENVDQQRGRGVFGKSIHALQALNKLGYGRAGSPLKLNLVYNPLGAFLPPAQAELEAKYHEELRRLFGIEFHHLFTITNMPIKRFAEQLERSGQYAAYMALLVNHFNPATVDALMCRDLVSIGYDGRLYDCDFNQMLDIPASSGKGPQSVFELESLDALLDRPIATAPHCFGCTAGAGSSCGGELGG